MAPAYWHLYTLNQVSVAGAATNKRVIWLSAAMAGWQHRCIPRIRRNSSEHPLLLEPVSSSVPYQRIIKQQRSQNRNRVAQSRWFCRLLFCTPSRQPPFSSIAFQLEVQRLHEYQSDLPKSLDSHPNAPDIYCTNFDQVADMQTPVPNLLNPVILPKNEILNKELE